MLHPDRTGAFPLLRGNQGQGGVGLHDVAPAKILEERPDAGEIAGNRFPAHAAVGKSGKIPAEQVAVHPVKGGDTPCAQERQQTGQVVIVRENGVGRVSALPFEVLKICSNRRVHRLTSRRCGHFFAHEFLFAFRALEILALALRKLGHKVWIVAVRACFVHGLVPRREIALRVP